jgi:hypothetical protein
MIAATEPSIVDATDSVLHVRAAIEAELDRVDHVPTKHGTEDAGLGDGDGVREQLEDLGYM